MTVTTSILGSALLLGVIWYLATTFFASLKDKTWPDFAKMHRPDVAFGPLGFIVVAAPEVTIVARYHTEPISLFRQHWDVAITSVTPLKEGPACSKEEAIAIASAMVQQSLAKKGTV